MFVSISMKEKLELRKRSDEINESYHKHDHNNGNKLNNKYIYPNYISDIFNNYGIKWNGDDIDQFIEESSKPVFQNKHDGLMFFISSHSDRDKVIYDNESEIYKLDSILSMYSSRVSILLESYREIQQESNHLLSILKMFFLDVGCGKQKTKVTNIETQKNETKTKTTTNKKQATTNVVIEDMKKEESTAGNETEIDEQKTQTTQRSFQFSWKCTNILAQQQEKKEYTFVLKRTNKEYCRKLVTNHELLKNVCKYRKIW